MLVQYNRTKKLWILCFGRGDAFYVQIEGRCSSILLKTERKGGDIRGVLVSLCSGFSAPIKSSSLNHLLVRHIMLLRNELSHARNKKGLVFGLLPHLSGNKSLLGIFINI